MNRERIKILRDHLRNLKSNNFPIGFNMGSWFHKPQTTFFIQPKQDCGTVACIAGHAIEIFWPGGVEEFTGDIEYEAMELLGLDEDDSFDLFYARGCEDYLNEVTSCHAAETLNLMLEGQPPAVAWYKSISELVK